MNTTRSRVALFVASIAGATMAMALGRRGAEGALRDEIKEFISIPPTERGPRPPRKTSQRWRTLAALARMERKGFFSMARSGSKRAFWFQRPHSMRKFVAIERVEGGRKYHQCMNYEDALSHKPYIIEHLNGFGQVAFRENFERLQRATALRETMIQTLASAQ